MGARREADLEIDAAHVWSPDELATRVLGVVEVLERADGVLECGREDAGREGVRHRPERRGADESKELEAAYAVPCLPILVVGGRVGRHFDCDSQIDRTLYRRTILHHALEITRKGDAALELELGEDGALGVVRDRATADEPPREMALVVLLEHVLVGQMPEDGDRLLEHAVDLGLALALEPLGQVAVEEEGEELGRARKLVHEVTEGLRRQR